MNYSETVLAGLRQRNAHEPEFLQVVSEVLETITPLLDAKPEYQKAAILERCLRNHDWVTS